MLFSAFFGLKVDGTLDLADISRSFTGEVSTSSGSTLFQRPMDRHYQRIDT